MFKCSYLFFFSNAISWRWRCTVTRHWAMMTQRIPAQCMWPAVLSSGPSRQELCVPGIERTWSAPEDEHDLPEEMTDDVNVFQQEINLYQMEGKRYITEGFRDVSGAPSNPQIPYPSMLFPPAPSAQCVTRLHASAFFKKRVILRSELQGINLTLKV